MLKKLLGFFAQRQEAQRGPHVVPPQSHPLEPSRISRGARTVVETLQDHGFQAYVVGGCVRDMLLGLNPKDFDVATDARPEQIRKLFRRSRIVGRRFRIVHVMVGREVVEVTTFRAAQEGDDHPQVVRTEEGLLLADNAYGDIDSDAARRDFTVNALYYQPRDNTLYDYAGGLADLERRELVVIGDPETRYREDPVRMLRAVRFGAKLGFAIGPAAAAPLPALGHLLAQVAPARLFDEFLKLFLNGHALATFQLLREHRLFEHLFPDTAACLAAGDDFAERFLVQAMTNTDLRVRSGKTVTPAFLLAALLWPVVERECKSLEGEGEAPALALQKAASRVLLRQLERIAIPRRFSLPMREIWELQLRLPRREGNRAEHLLALPRFRAAYDFLLLREASGEDLGGLGHWWTRYQEADEAGRRAMVEALGRGPKGRRRRRPRKRKSDS